MRSGFPSWNFLVADFYFKRLILDSFTEKNGLFSNIQVHLAVFCISMRYLVASRVRIQQRKL